MTAAVGFPTLRLIRVAVGGWTLGGLLPGESMEMAKPMRGAAAHPGGAARGVGAEACVSEGWEPWRPPA